MYASEASAAGRWRVCMYLGRRRVIIIPTTPDTRIQEVASQTRDVKDRDLQKRYNHTRKDSISERKCQKCRCIFASYCRRCSAHSRRTQRTRAAPAAPRLVSGPRPRPPGEESHGRRAVSSSRRTAQSQHNLSCVGRQTYIAPARAAGTLTWQRRDLPGQA